MASFLPSASSEIIRTYYQPQGNLLVYSSPLHGEGVKSARHYATGDVIYSEKPLCILQTLPNTQDVLVCGACHKILGSFELQIKMLSKELTRQTLATQMDPLVDSAAPTNDVFHCPDRCGEFYCSTACRDQHWSRHQLLCTGALTEEEAATSPLIRFKIHACETNEIFLLVADVFAKICTDIDMMRQSKAGAGNGEDVAIIAAALAPYDRFVRNLWWDCVVVDHSSSSSEPNSNITQTATKDDDDRGNDENLPSMLKQLVTESWALLQEVLNLDGRGLTHVLTAEYMARTIGMFEQNNIGVRCTHPLTDAAASLYPHTSFVAPFLAGAEKISAYLDAQGDDDDADEWEDVDGEGDEGDTCEEETAMDEENEQPTGDVALDKLRSLIRETGSDRLFPPLDGTALYSTLCKINHSCEPNVLVTYTCTQEHGLVAKLHALRPIVVGEELLQSYVDQTMDWENRRKALAEYGFCCTCTKCQLQS